MHRREFIGSTIAASVALLGAGPAAAAVAAQGEGLAPLPERKSIRVAFMLGDLYESKAYRQYYRAVEYYQRCYQWNPKTSHEARIRAARIYDKHLRNRGKAIELYREVTTHEVDPRRKQEAEKRIAELSGAK